MQLKAKADLKECFMVSDLMAQLVQNKNSIMIIGTDTDNYAQRVFCI